MRPIYIVVSLWGGCLTNAYATWDRDEAYQEWYNFAENVLGTSVSDLEDLEILDKLDKEHYSGDFDEEVHIYESEIE